MLARVLRCIATMSLCLASLPAISASEAPADLVLVNGKVATMDPAHPAASAIAVRNGHIVAVGTDAEVTALAGPGTKKLDASGRRVVPGFIEGHGHFMSLGESLMTLDLRGARDWDTIVAQVREAAAKA